MSESSISQPELKNCPFCGGPAAYTKLSGGNYGLSHHIGCSGPSCFVGPHVRATRKDDVTFRWNRRA